MSSQGHLFKTGLMLAASTAALFIGRGAAASTDEAFVLAGRHLAAPAGAVSPLAPLTLRSSGGAVCAGEVSVVGPSGAVPVHAHCLEGGHALQIAPEHDLLPGAQFTLLLKSGHDLDSVAFETAILPAPESIAAAGKNVEEWAPKVQRGAYDWTFGSSGIGAKVEALTAPAGHTAVAGRLARFDGEPLVGALVGIDGHASRTDAEGRFLIDGVTAGSQVLKVDATDVWIDGGHYTKQFVHVDVAGGRTTALPRSIYLARVDPATEVGIASPTDREIVLTHPQMPGLEVHIPKGVVLRQFDGAIVRRVSLTPVPIDRAPYELPPTFSTYFTMQPAGAFIDGDASQAVRITYPNTSALSAGTNVDFWNYDPRSGWEVYGGGAVTADRASIVADAGVGYRELMSFGQSWGSKGPTAKTAPPGGAHGLDPVDLATGLFLYNRTDLSIDDVIPISLSWSYQQSESSVGPLGMGTHLSYGAKIFQASTAEYDLILADGTIVPFKDNIVSQAGNGKTLLTSAQCLGVPGVYYGATMTAFSNPNYPHANQIKVTFRDQRAWFFDGDSPNPLMEMDDANGNAVKLNWADANGADYFSVSPRPQDVFLSKITSPSGRFITLTYPSIGNVATNILQSVQDNAGRKVVYNYVNTLGDGKNYLSTITEPDQVGQGSPKYVRYDWYSTTSPIRFKSVTDKLGNVVLLNHYDSVGRVHQQDLALEPGMTATPFWLISLNMPNDGSHCPAGQSTCLGQFATVAAVTNPRGYTTNYVFDASGYTIQEDIGTNVVAPYKRQTYLFTRDPLSHNILSMRDPLQRLTTFGYDDRGNVNRVTRMANNSAETVSTNMIYDPNLGRVTSLTNEVGSTTQLDYDSVGNLVGVTDPLNNLAQFKNNAYGLIQQITDPLNHASTLGYKLADLSNVTDALGRKVQFTTDELGRRDSVMDAAGNRSSIGYDVMDNTVQLTDPLSNATTLQRDVEGNLQNLTLAGHAKAYVYGFDAYGRIVSVQDPMQRTGSLQYDGNGNRTQYKDFKSQITNYQYDPFDRLHLVTYNDNSTTTYTYDDGNRLTQVVDSLYGTTTITPDDYDHVKSVAGRYGSPVGYQIDSIERVQTLTYPSGLKLTSLYYPDNRLHTLTLSGSNETFKAIYQANGRLSTLTLPNNSTRTQLYNDPTDQIASITYTDPNQNTLGAWAYTYDATSGRLQSMSDTFASSANVAGTALTTSTFDDANEITAIGATSLGHDPNGSQTSDIGLAFMYDVRGRLQQTTKGSLITHYEINPFGLRDRKWASDGSETRFVYDVHGHLVAELDKNNATQIEYVWFGDMPVMVRNFTAGVASEFYVYSDNLNTPRRVVTPSSGLARWVWNSDAYGNGAPNGNPGGAGIYTFHLRLPGQFYDSETALIYNSARDYNSATGRYIQSDPTGFWAGLNTYAYGRGNPVGNADPTGKAPNPYLVIGSGVVGGLINMAMNASNDRITGFASFGAGFIGGAAGGAIGNPLFSGFVAGGITSGLTEYWSTGRNANSVVMQTAFGATVGLVGGIPIAKLAGNSSDTGVFVASTMTSVWAGLISSIFFPDAFAGTPGGLVNRLPCK